MKVPESFWKLKIIILNGLYLIGTLLESPKIKSKLKFSIENCLVQPDYGGNHSKDRSTSETNVSLVYQTVNRLEGELSHYNDLSANQAGPVVSPKLNRRRT